MAKTDDAITPSRLRADGWEQDGPTHWRIYWGVERHLAVVDVADGSFLYCRCYVRIVTGMADLRSLVKALKGGE